MTAPNRLADCHLHFEGTLPPETLTALARRAGHRFADPAAFEAERSRIVDAKGFLALYAEVCGLFRAPRDYGEAAEAISRSLAEGGLAYAEIFVSPEIAARFGLDSQACLVEIDRAFRKAEAEGGTRCRILL
ncbi:MAG TPA: hypothetical protein VNC59_09970, partial [Thermoanaerobaculia bacterium]|nr:hypothetical protein [Thermoanaerobaculia bacterium]